MKDIFTVFENLGAVGKKAREATEKFHMSSDVLIEVRDKNGDLKQSSFQHNLRTNAGADFWDAQLFKVATAAATANFIALTTDTVAPAAGDTTLANRANPKRSGPGSSRRHSYRRGIV